MAEKIIIGGGSGLIGTRLTEHLAREGYKIFIISRSAENAAKEFSAFEGVEFLEWQDESKITAAMESSAAVINLAGASVAGKRWSDEYKKVLYDSRIKTTALLVNLMAKCAAPPRSFICSSAIGIYGFTGDEKLTESSPAGNDFLAKLTVEWEKAAFKAVQYNIRTVCMRTGVVLDKDDGALPQMTQPFKFFAGGYFASGRQWLSWIHIKDTIGLYKYCIENNMEGAVNVTAPEPVTNKDFCETAGKVLKKPCWAKVPAFGLKIMLGEFAGSLINGQRVIPEKALKHGYKFKYTHLKDALENLLQDK